MWRKLLKVILGLSAIFSSALGFRRDSYVMVAVPTPLPLPEDYPVNTGVDFVQAHFNPATQAFEKQGPNAELTYTPILRTSEGVLTLCAYESSLEQLDKSLVEISFHENDDLSERFFSFWRKRKNSHCVSAVISENAYTFYQPPLPSLQLSQLPPEPVCSLNNSMGFK